MEDSKLMRQWRVGVGMVLVLGMAATAGAEPGKGRGQGRPESTEEHVERAGKRVVNEAADAVADELTGNRGYVNSSGGPPGLQGRRPPGLEKQDKTPPGWSKGRKAGWDKTQQPQHESFIRRVIHGIFHRRQPSSPSSTSKN